MPNYVVVGVERLFVLVPVGTGAQEIPVALFLDPLEEPTPFPLALIST